MNKKPTKIQIKAALKVLRYYRPKAKRLVCRTEQEKPAEWSRSLEVCVDLLRSKDPDALLDAYLKEWKLGR